MNLKLSAPTVPIWGVAVILGVLGILATLVTIPVLSPMAFWMVALAFIILAVATTVKGM
ncbi:MAG TPA: hypothetical protein VM536_13160 [Chloroflexia bacterium]|nr:hypothetical protein [Chloroflexia bacterium]